MGAFFLTLSWGYRILGSGQGLLLGLVPWLVAEVGMYSSAWRGIGMYWWAWLGIGSWRKLGLFDLGRWLPFWFGVFL